MTDRFNGLIVVLEKDIRDDDAQCLLDAIRMMKGVKDVTGNVVDVDTYVTEARVRIELRNKLQQLISEI